VVGETITVAEDAGPLEISVKCGTRGRVNVVVQPRPEVDTVTSRAYGCCMMIHASIIIYKL
jgi:hypothetical protein